MTRKSPSRTLNVVFSSAFALIAAAAATPVEAAPCGTDNVLAGKKPHLAWDTKGDVAQLTDGIIAPEGASWDAPVGISFDAPTGAVTYDLGEARSISAVVVQADANDIYKVSGSVDGAPASYKPITELANVVSKGHGMRTRAVEFPATNVRYLRLGEASGDNYFSVTEFAAYCTKPSPFPPAMKVVDAPPAQVGQGAPAATAQSKDGGRSFLLLAVAALGLAWLAYRTIKRGSPPPPDGASGSPEPGSAPAASDKPGEAGGGSGGSGGPAAPGGTT